MSTKVGTRDELTVGQLETVSDKQSGNLMASLKVVQ